MTIPVNALPASELRAAAPAAAQPPKTIAEPREPAAPDAAGKKPQATPAEKTEALAVINDGLKTASVSLRFEFDNDADQMIARVTDTETGKVIRQMPSEEALHVSKAMDRLQGLLVSQKV